MLQIFSLRQKTLAFPGGTPGIDTSHPAANRLVASVFPYFPSGINLGGASGFQKGSHVGGTNAVGFDPYLGPYIGGSDIIQFNRSAFPTTLPAGSGFTFGSFFRLTPNSGNMGIMNSGANNTGVIYQACLSTNQLGMRINGVQNYSSGITPVTNAPYFYACSFFYDGTNGKANHVILRLDTGSILTATTTAACAAPTGYNTNTFFYRAAAASLNGIIGPAMLNAVALSIPQLLLWASDPWDFWYPERLDLVNMIVPTPVSAVVGAGTLPFMGVG